MSYFFDDDAFNARFTPNYTHVPFPVYNPYGYTQMPGSGIRGPGYALPGMAGAQSYSGARQRYESQYGTPLTTASATLLGPSGYASGGSQNFFGPAVQAASLTPSSSGGGRRGRR